MSQLKLIENAERVVEEALHELKCSQPALIVDKKNRIVLSDKIVQNRVCVLSGGGSGHEPFSIGFVGDGLLSGAVAGSAHESPSSRAILSAIRVLSKQNENSGILVIIMNYPNDILNFGIAVEEAKSQGIDVEMVVINEDYFQPAMDDITDSSRVGMCGNCFVFKIAGNMAKCGEKLPRILNECYVINNSMCTVGAVEEYRYFPEIRPLFKRNADDMDVSSDMACSRTYRNEMRSIDELVSSMVTKILMILNLSSDDEVCVAIHRFGSVSQLEIGAICNKVYNILTDLGITTRRMYHGSHMPSVDLTGFQISILNTSEHPDWIQALDEATDAPAWPSTCISIPSPMIHGSSAPRTPKSRPVCKVGPKFTSEEALLFEKCLRSTANVVLRKENRVSELDNLSKDGDAGSTLRRIAERLLQDMPKLDLEYPAVCFYHLSRISQTIGGSSGILYSTLMTSCSRFIITASTIDWVQMWKTSLDSFLCYSRAKIGDKTMFMKNLREVLLKPMYTQLKKKTRPLKLKSA